MNTTRNRTYKDVAQQALTEYAETVLSEIGGYGSARAIAAAAWDTMIDALVEVGVNLSEIGPFLDTVVEDYVEDPWGNQPDDNAALLRQAAEILTRVAESL